MLSCRPNLIAMLQVFTPAGSVVPLTSKSVHVGDDLEADECEWMRMGKQQREREATAKVAMSWEEKETEWDKVRECREREWDREREEAERRGCEGTDWNEIEKKRDQAKEASERESHFVRKSWPESEKTNQEAKEAREYEGSDCTQMKRKREERALEKECGGWQKEREHQRDIMKENR